ncbi:MAG: site-specific integrase [Clostridia bacterium]|nr:site-specific integrase [Clostridia bacterium]
MKRRADGRWKKAVTINGKRKTFYSTAKTEKQAERDLLQQIMNFNEAEERGALFVEVADKWERDHLPKLAHSTAEGYKSLIAFAMKYFEYAYIKDIRPIHIKQFMQKKINQGYSAKRVEHQMSVLGMILKYACIEGYITDNPAQYITVPKGLPKKPRTIPNKQEMETVKISTDAPFGLIAYTLLHLGLRKGELLALEATDIDRKNNRVHINKSVYFKGNAPYIKRPKTPAGERTVILPECLKEVLPKQHIGLIFRGKNGLMTHSEFQSGWKSYQKSTGLNITPHQLRHAYASYILHDSKIDVKTAQYLMGHADISTTQNIYTQITEQALSDASQLISAHLEGQNGVSTATAD